VRTWHGQVLESQRNPESQPFAATYIHAAQHDVCGGLAATLTKQNANTNAVWELK
jgi:hypothetical protein